MSSTSKWNDLAPRLMSALVMLAVGGAAIWSGGLAFLALIAAVIGLMIWELMRMLAPQQRGAALWLGLLSGAVTAGVGFAPPVAHLPLLLAPVLVGLSTVKSGRWIWLSYAVAIMLCGYSALDLRAFGLFWVLWLVAIVVMSDVAGYFAGRLLGGPKFWPRVSPKKTWSGTVAGWIGAAFVGAWFMTNSAAGWGLVVVSVIMAFAAQMGDIAESAIKRKTGIKDSSNLIPGHGGFLDRFDGMLGALLLVLLAGLVVDVLPEAR